MSVKQKFEKIGAYAKVYAPEHPERRGQEVRIDVNGETFDIRTTVPIVVLDVDPEDKHLLLMARMSDGTKPKYLCGYDERGWFAAALPEPQHVRWLRGQKPSIARGISDIESAKASLKPGEVVEAERKKKLKRRKRNKRVNAASKRQGEWFFIPARLEVKDQDILHKEPIRMGNKRQHVCAEVYRRGGEEVWVNSEYPNGLTNQQYAKLFKEQPKYNRPFQRMVRQAEVFARGKVTAPDHAPLYLDGWHKVVPNTENLAIHGRQVAFLD